MAAVGGAGGRGVPSPRPTGRENAKTTLCKNVTIYGSCRFEKPTDGRLPCPYLHPPSAKSGTTPSPGDNPKKGLNVDSPSYVPLQPVPNGLSSSPRGAKMSPQAAGAKPFVPGVAKSRNFTTSSTNPTSSSSEWNTSSFQEFVPGYDASQLTEHHASTPLINASDPFTVASATGSLGFAGQNHGNPYAQDAASLSAASFFQNAGAYTPGAGAFAQPAQYHQYFPMGPHRDNFLAYQRTAHDFFLADHLREDLQRKSDASRQTLPNSSLPSQVEHFHTLVPLDTNNQRDRTLFGYPSWVYKAVSLNDGKLYTLRRLEGYKASSDKPIHAAQGWKRIRHANMVSLHEVFTTRAFNDTSSLIFVTDYHPLSKTVMEQHLQPQSRYQGRNSTPHVAEGILWGYLVQLASALQSIHSQGLAAQTILPTKVILTSKNRIRLNGCGILDVVKYESTPSIPDLQQEDLAQLGRLMLCIANTNVNATNNMPRALENIARVYSQKLADCVGWLVAPADYTQEGMQPRKDINLLLGNIAPQIAMVLDSAFHEDDTIMSSLTRELENGRLVRILAKLGAINERPEFEHSPQWSETGERYYLKLFRDYVFHQVDANGNPAVDLGHIVNCLNKLDAGSEERIYLTSRDEQNVLVVSYRELKRGVESSFQELLKAGRGR